MSFTTRKLGFDSLILDPEGRVAYQAMGERAWDSDEILDKVRKLKTDADEAVKDGL